jgi:predicted phosphohydrolase
MSITVQYASDLHLEFSDNRDYLEENPLLPFGEVLVLCGDIVPFAIMHKHARFFDFVSDNFAATYWLPGNHEFYGVDVQRMSGEVNKPIKDNVFLVNNTTAQYKDLTLVFSTLWSSISPENKWEVAQQFNDFTMIKYNDQPLTVDQYNQLHQQNLAFVETALQKAPTDKKLVCTHHVPTFKNYPRPYKGLALSDALGTELEDFIGQTAPTGWLYGHHHTNTPDFTIGSTLLATNQLGYVKYGQHQQFSAGKCITI